MTDHKIAWRITEYGVRGDVTCTATEGAQCRKKCSGTCDWWSDDSTGTCVNCGSKIVDAGECMMVPWLDDAEDYYLGQDRPLIDGPIVMTWDEGVGVVWCYPENMR